MTFRASFAIVLALLVPSAALAGPISVTGTWSATTSTVPTGNGSEALELLPFWAGASWDGQRKGIRYLLEEYGDLTGLEYLHDGAGNYTSFLFDDEIINTTKIGGITAWTNGVFGRRADGAFTYNSGTGRVSNSFDSGQQYALFRIVQAEYTQYFLGIEDILLSEPLNDRDYNDYIVAFQTPTPVPEPGTMLLLGSGIAALVARRKVAVRKVRAAATV